MMMGLTVATVIGVPLATWLGQHFGWRAGFEFSATIAFFTLIAVACFVPNIPVQATASIKTELAGLKNINMWLTLAVGAIGFGACSRYIAMSHQFSLNTPKLISRLFLLH